MLGGILDKTAGHHEGIRDYKYLIVFQGGKARKSVRAEMNGRMKIKALHYWVSFRKK
jgi:hypothetical protein